MSSNKSTKIPTYSREALNMLHKKHDAYIEVFEPAVNLADKQFSIQWPWKEFPVQDDVHYIKTEFPKKHLSAVVNSLKLFTLYELKAGNEYWGGKIAKTFTPACIRRMAAGFANAEMNSHAPFYNALNSSLNLATMEFYEAYKESKVLSDRMVYIDSVIASKDLAESTLAFSMVEGAALYSTFAYLKHYNAKGGNGLRNLASGLNSSVKEENLHSLGGALLFNLETQYLERPIESYQDIAYELATRMAEHEKEINAITFSEGELETYTLKQANNFAEHRVDVCLANAGFKPLFKPKYNPVADWFYDDINSLRLHDFFAQGSGEYTINWVAEAFELEDGWRE